MPHRTHRLHACTGTWTGADADARPRHRQATGREHTHWLRVAMPPTPAPCAPHSHMGRCAAMRHFKRRAAQHHRWRPYRVEYTGSLLTSEVKRHRARLVLGWGTAWEDLRVLSAFCEARRTPPGEKVIFSGARRRQRSLLRHTPTLQLCHASLTACAVRIADGPGTIPPHLVTHRHTCRAQFRHTSKHTGIPVRHNSAIHRNTSAHISADGHTASNAPDLF